MHDKNPALIAAIGNPNLDCVIKIPDRQLLETYNLQDDSQTEGSYEMLKEIEKYAEENEYEKWHVAGGLEQNTLRVFQWLIREPFKTVMFGAVGDDEEATVLQEDLYDCDVLSRYTKIPHHRTSYVIIIAYKGDRSAVANIDAACEFREQHLKEIDWDIICNAKLILSSGFFALHSLSIYTKAFNNVRRVGACVFNIGGVYVFEERAEDITELCKTCDILIGNKYEFEALIKSVTGNQYSDTVSGMKMFHKIMLQNVRKNSGPYEKEWKKIIIVTAGPDPVHCIFGNGDLLRYEVSPLQEDVIVDSTGCGDAFLAGFLYGLLYKHDIYSGLVIGAKTSRAILKEHGVTIPKYSSATLGL